MATNFHSTLQFFIVCVEEVRIHNENLFNHLLFFIFESYIFTDWFVLRNSWVLLGWLSIYKFVIGIIDELPCLGNSRGSLFWIVYVVYVKILVNMWIFGLICESKFLEFSFGANCKMVLLSRNFLQVSSSLLRISLAWSWRRGATFCKFSPFFSWTKLSCFVDSP